MSRWRIVRPFLVFVLPLSVEGDALSAKELLKLEGKALQEAAEQSSYSFYGSEEPYSTEELIAIAEKLVSAESKNALGGSFGHYFSKACDQANVDQLERLIAIYKKIAPDSFDKSSALNSVAALWISRESKALEKEGRRVEAHFTAPALPDELRSTSKEAQEAWKLYAGFDSVYQQTFKTPESQTVDAYLNRKSFCTSIDHALEGKTGEEMELQRYAWTGANCLNVTDDYDMKNTAIFLMLLRERRLDLAVGAAMRVVGTGGSTSNPEKIARQIIELFGVIGVDWEMIFAGGEADFVAKGYGSWNRQPLLEALAAYGSDWGIDRVNDLAATKGSDRESFLEAFNIIIEENPSAKKIGDAYYGPSRRMEGKRLGSVSKAVQERSLHLVESFTVDGETPGDSARSEAGIFARTQAASSIPALTKLAEDAPRDAAVLARSTLTIMGQPAPAVMETSVKYKILVNGEPLPPGAEIGYSMRRQNGDTEGMTGEVDQDGMLEISSSDSATRRNPAVEVSLRGTPKIGAQFEISTPFTGGSGAIQTVSVSAHPLEINLHDVDRLNAPFDGNLSVRIQTHDEESVDRPRDEFYSHENVASDGGHFSQLTQDGIYDVWIGATGSEIWHRVVEVGPGARGVDAYLKPGSNLKFSVIVPGLGETSIGRLYRDGKELNSYYPAGEVKYLPCGSYVLKIPGSGAFERRRGEREIARGPDEVAFNGRDISFTISPGSPPLIDLGEITLDPAP